MRRILILTLLILPCIYTAAQQYPVQVTPQLLPPYTLQVSEYHSPGAAGAKLNLLLLLRDFNKPTLQVRLRMSIEGQSVSLRTRADAVFTPITLESGIPKYVDPSELGQYFNSNNLDFSGMTRQQYEQTGKLPEGFYTFCFEVIEAGTNLVVSNKGCGMAWLTLNEPPLLNIPRKAEELIPSDPTNIIFQWTPRHTASPTAAFNTEYKFYITELTDDAIAPEAAFLSFPILDSITVNTTMLIYTNLNMTPLIEGRKYAWRVQALAKEGLQELAMFRNNGFSETFWFTYQNNCALPQGVNELMQGERARLTWNANVNHLEYKVEYREKNKPDAVWFEIGNTIPHVSIGDLKHSTTYEYRIGAACELGKFIFSPLDEFHTNDTLSSTVANCGIDPNLAATDEPLLQQMNAGDTIKAGDFNVITTQVSGSAGNFSGQGYVEVSYLANMKLGVRFANIGVATDKKLKTGVIETTYDATEGGIADVDEVIDIIKNLAGLINDLLSVNIDEDSAYFHTLIDQVKEVVEKELPHDMKEGFQTATQILDSAKTAYDSLKNIYDDLPAGPQKDAIGESMDAAKERFSDAQKDLIALNKEREKLISDIVDIVVTSVKKIQKDFNYEDISKLTKVADSLKTQIFQDQSLEDSVENSTLEFVELETFTEEYNGFDADYTEFNSKVKNYLTEKNKLLKNKLFELLFDVFGSTNSFNDKAKEDELFNGRILIRTLMERLDKKETRQSLITFTVRFLNDAIAESAQMLNN